MRRAAFATTIAVMGACGFDATLLRDEIPAPADGGDDAPADAAVEPAVLDAVGPDAEGVFAGQYHTCALVAGTAYCWGSNVLGALGTGNFQGSVVPVPVVPRFTFATLSAGENHTCGVEWQTGRLLCWGDSASGQLGVGDTMPHPFPVPVTLPSSVTQLTTGYYHTCAILSDGALWCWGKNAEGELGEDPGGDAGDAFFPRRIGTDNDWLAVSGGQGHTCGLRAPGILWCWGRNTDSELGLGENQPIQIRTLTRVGAFDDWVQIDVGQNEGCGIRKDGSLYCWGADGPGELGPRPDTDGGAVVLWRPTQVGTRTDWAIVNTDLYTTCAINTAGALYCWGRNAEGQLGTGDIIDHDTPTATGDGDTYLAVSVGRFHVCAETTARIIRCTGADESGQLGLGGTARRSRFTDVAIPAPH
jgi:alpha-tubulin suppressor-like RCC1 family protein